MVRPTRAGPKGAGGLRTGCLRRLATLLLAMAALRCAAAADSNRLRPARSCPVNCLSCGELRAPAAGGCMRGYGAVPTRTHRGCFD
jgi:hypothetical protein